MRVNIPTVLLTRKGYSLVSFNFTKTIIKRYHGIPFLNLYQKVTGHPISDDIMPTLKRRHPNLDRISQEQIEYVLQILNKFGITALEACHNPHVFSMNVISMENYGDILKECGFIKIKPEYIIRYHTIVRSRTIAYLKKEGLLRQDLNLEEVLQNCFLDWPKNQKPLNEFSDSTTSILTVRTSVLEKYLQLRLSVTKDEFEKFCKNYLPLRHRPMCDISEALNIAQNEIKFDVDSIRRNGFIISSDPTNTKLILENVKTLAGYDIREAIRIEPAILKNNYNSLLEIKNTLQAYGISEEAQRHCLRAYCMCPQTIQERLEQLKDLKEYQILSTNPRVLSLVVHKRKMMSRLEKIQSAKKQCYSLNHLVSSTKAFNNYINSFGSKVWSKDIAVLISSCIQAKKVKNHESSATNKENEQSKLRKAIVQQLKRHKYWLHSSLYIINENLQYLNEIFYGDVIVNNCQILLYPLTEIKQYLEFFLMKRNHNKAKNIVVELDGGYNNLNYSDLTDDQILSLVLYEIEKRYHFSGDGIWSKQDGVKTESPNLSQQMMHH
ncbi:unnamed protein product [Parnassius apollo]|uniref:(apollo) hypothetical protein n=1 Tax=Parnassius apollo TaxID=110799 RepID=A0A8S3XD46_PARAO|nr:unnamed protein product [Parnassius apollo]